MLRLLSEGDITGEVSIHAPRHGGAMHGRGAAWR